MLAILLFQMSKLIIRVPPKESLQLNDISELPSFCLFSKAGFLRRRRVGGPTDFHCNIASSRKSLQIPGGGRSYSAFSVLPKSLCFRKRLLLSPQL